MYKKTRIVKGTELMIMEYLAEYYMCSKETIFSLGSRAYMSHSLINLVNGGFVEQSSLKITTNNKNRENKIYRLTLDGKDYLKRKYPQKYKNIRDNKRLGISPNIFDKYLKISNVHIIFDSIGIINRKKDKPRILESEEPLLLGQINNEKYNETAILKQVIEKGVFYNSKEVKFEIENDDKNHYNFSIVVGLLLNKGKTYAIYEEKKCKIKWKTRGELDYNERFLNTIMSKSGNLFYQSITDIIIFFRNKPVYKNIIKNKLRHTHHYEGYEKIFTIPETKEGIELLKKIIDNPDFINDIRYKYIDTGKYELYNEFIDFTDKDYNKYIICADFNINKYCVACDMLLMDKKLKKNENNKYYIICYKWQKEYFVNNKLDFNFIFLDE